MMEEEQFSQFEKMGVAHVRDFAPQWGGPLAGLAYQWLKLKDDEAQSKEDEARRFNEASQTEQLRIAREAKKSAQIAATAAIVAIPIAIIAIILSALSWLYPRH
jgi:hypothetical protein